jgi:hypothetical protein
MVKKYTYTAVTIFILIIVTLYYFLSNQSHKINITVSSNYCGSVILICSDDATYRSNFEIDSTGFEVVNKKIFQGAKVNIKVFKETIDITDSCKQIFSGMVFFKNNGIEYHTLYIPCDHEKNKGKDYWDKSIESNNIESRVLDYIEKNAWSCNQL